MTNLYRSIWIEDPENRKLIFDDQINVAACPKCRTRTKLEFPFLCTNVKKRIAVWWEPYPDPDIDKDLEQYKKHFGAGSFYASAPRVRDWEEFKGKIIELEQAQIGPSMRFSAEAQGMMAGFLEFLKARLSAKKESDAGSGLLAFKDGVAALEYACKFMDCPLREGVSLPALVIDSRGILGETAGGQTLEDGNQIAVLRVASDDGGFLVLATTSGPKGPKLHVGDLVAWVAVRHSPEVSASMSSKDPRSGWIGLIIGTLKPEHCRGKWIGGAKFSL